MMELTRTTLSYIILMIAVEVGNGDFLLARESYAYS